jgi:ABC-type spermidine/putrescine transport system permease subunit II
MYVFVVYLFLFIPPVYTLYLSLYPTPSPIVLVPDRFTLQWFATALTDTAIIGAFRNSVIVSVVAAVVTTVLAILAGRAYTQLPESRLKQAALFLILIPVFVPGIVLGLALLVYFNFLTIATGLPTLIITGILWSLPFAVLILLTTYTNINAAHRRASYDLGASPLTTFRRIELPLIVPGVLGSAFFSFLFTFNEYIRSSFVNGSDVTIPVQIFSLVNAFGLPPEMYAMSSLMIVVTVVGIVTYIGYTVRTTRT